MYTTHIWQVSLGGQAGVVTGRKMLENIDEFVQERLALYTHEEVFEVIFVETAGPAAVAPKLHRGHMHIFFSHTELDSSQAECARGMAFGDHGISGSVSLYTRQGGLACGGLGDRRNRRKEGADPADDSQRRSDLLATRTPGGCQKPAPAESGHVYCRE